MGHLARTLVKAMPAAALVITALAGVVVAAVVGAMRLVPPGGVDGATPEALLPLLIAAALLCVTGLAARREPSVAWLAAIGALAILTVDIAAIARAARPAVDAPTWRWLSVGVAAAALATSMAAIAYAADPRRRLGRWVMIGGVVAFVVVAATAVWAVADAGGPSTAPDVAGSSPLGSTGVVTRMTLIVTLIFVALGLLGDGRPAWRRARRRVAVEEPIASDARARVALVPTLARAWLDELAPGRTQARRAAIAERSRIARDLHADVVPALRRAIGLAEDGASMDRLAATLRETLQEVEALSAAEHAVQLDIGGIVMALESMAERVEERSGSRVTLDVVEPGASGEPAGEPPAEVAAAAFRVSGLALDNVIRHAPGADIAIEVLATSAAVRLEIADDGPGLSLTARSEALAAGRRGLVDMVTEASACGAAVEVGPGVDGRGTVVRFAWPAP